MVLIASECRRLNIPFMLIGAIARDVLLSHIRTIEEAFRLTEDLDISVSVGSWDVFRALREALLSHDAVSSTSRPHTLTIDGLSVDLVPFGGLEDPSGYVSWEKDYRVFNVEGYSEALGEAEFVRVSNIAVRVVPLPAYVPLKTLAWRDRAEARDAEDICTVLKSYYTAEIESILERHSDLFELESGDVDFVGARSYGRLVKGSPAVSEQLRSSMRKMLDDENRRYRLALDMGSGCHHDPDGRGAILSRFMQGLDDEFS